MRSVHRIAAHLAAATLAAGAALTAPGTTQAAPPAPAQETPGDGATSAAATATAPKADRGGAGVADLSAKYWTKQKMRTAVSADPIAGTAPAKQTPRQPTGKPMSVPPAAPAKALIPKALAPKALVPEPVTPKAATPKAVTPKAADPKAASPKAAGPNAEGSKAAGATGPALLSVDPSASVGKVFFTNPANGLNYVCSAGTVNSGSKLLVMTAGHCVHGGSGGQWMQNWIFVPAYDYGYEPYGRWSAKYLTAFNAWINNSDLDRDVGWVTVWPNGSGQRPVDVVGGNGLSVNYSYEQSVTILAYPQESPYDGGWQQYCQGTTSRPGVAPSQENKIQLQCGFTGGSSGGPWLRSYNGSLGYVNGIMSTLNGSGWNKSPYFDTAVSDVYNLVANRT